MAHEIEGNKAFFVTEPAWHGLGTILSTAPSIEEAWKLAYPHTLFKLDIQAVMAIDDGSVHTMPLSHSKAIVRDDGVELNTVGADFELVQPYEVLDTFRPLLDSKLVELEAGGSLRDGRQMWALGKIKQAETEIVKGDSIKGYFLMFTGFDGTLRLGMTQTNVRVVCANTLAMAIGSKGERSEYRFKHTKNIRQRIADARTTIKEGIERFHKNTEAYKVLAEKKWSDRTMQVYVRNVLLTDDEQQRVTDGEDLSGKKEAIVQNVIELLDTQRGLEYVPAIRGTAWQAYNAVSEYVTHEYGRTSDSRLNAQWFGESAKINQKALTMALSM